MVGSPAALVSLSTAGIITSHTSLVSEYESVMSIFLLMPLHMISGYWSSDLSFFALAAVSIQQCCGFNTASLPRCWQLRHLSGAVLGVNALLEGTIAGGFSWRGDISTLHFNSPTRCPLPIFCFPNLPGASLSVLAGESFPLIDDVTDFWVDARRLQSKSQFFNISIHSDPHVLTPIKTPLSVC